MPSPWVDRHHDSTLYAALQTHSGGERGALAILNHCYHGMIAIDASKDVLFEPALRFLEEATVLLTDV